MMEVDTHKDTTDDIINLIKTAYVNIAKQYDDVYNKTQTPELQYRYFDVILDDQCIELEENRTNITYTLELDTEIHYEKDKSRV